MLIPLIASIWIYNMPAAPLVAAVAIDAASTAATSALIGGIAASTFGVVGGAIVTGAIGGAIGGTISAAAFGGDPGMGALTGAITGGVAGGVGSPASGITSDVRDALGVSQPVAEGLTKGATSFATGTLGGLAQGEKFGQALKGGAVSGLGSGLASGIGNELGLTSDQGNGPTERAQNERIFGNEGINGQIPNSISVQQPNSNNAPTERSGVDRTLNGAAQSALSYGIKSGLSDVFGSNTPTQFSPTGSQGQSGPSLSPPTPSLTSSGPNPSVDALAQALRTVGDLGYSPGGPVFGSQSDQPQRKVWNKASLRVTDENQ